MTVAQFFSVLIEGGPPTNVYPISCCFDLDLDLDPMTLTYKLDLDILSVPEMKLIGQGFSKAISFGFGYISNKLSE